jgi:hypothetical protein
MTVYAYFDHRADSPSPVLGWYDTVAQHYPTLPDAADLLELAEGEKSFRFDGGSWAVADGRLVQYTPPLPVLTLREMATRALEAGLTIYWESAPDLTGLYAVDAATTNHIQAEMLALIILDGFADGASTVSWPGMPPSSQIHVFNKVQFRAFAIAVASYVATLHKCINGVATVLPPAVVTIA